MGQILRSMERISSYYYYESRTQGKQSALIGQNNTEKIHIKQTLS